MAAENDRLVVYGPNYGAPLPNVTLGRELYNCFINNKSDRPAMIDAFTGKQLFYSELLQKTVNLAEALRIRGYDTEKTVISLSSENSLEFFVPVIASFYNSSIMATLSHHYTPVELKHTLNLTKPRVVFCSELVVKKFVELKKDLKYIERVILINSNKKFDGAEMLEDFVNDALRGRNVDVKYFQPYDRDPVKAVSFVLCSSGTTGLPKGVKLSHMNIFIRILHSRDQIFAYDDQVVIGVLPFFHGYGLITSIEGLSNGKLIVAINRFDEDIFLKSIQDYKIQTLFLAPPLAIFLAKTPKLKNYDLSSVKQVTCGAAPLSKSIEEELKQRLHLSNMRQGYGLTEATMAVILMQTDVHRPGSCGQVLSYMACKIRDPETGKTLGPNQVGELCLKGPMIMLGYYGDEKSTRESFTSDGWLKSGDLGYYDEESYFYVVDRLKELIKYKGFQVAPAELEALLVNHPKILDAAVVGVPDDLCGECPLAFVVKQPNAVISEKEIEQYISGLVSPQKRLSGGVIFVNAIPKNPSGKILRRELRQMLNKYVAKPQSKL